MPTLDDEEAIFHAARQITEAGKRQRYLDEGCAGDAALGARVEALLNVFDQKADMLPASGNDFRGPAVGATIGPYKLLEVIGEGGMGTVYLAEQIRPVQRRVALKIIKSGMDSQHVIARFEAERQALAIMDHPNIAKILDGGLTNEPHTVVSGSVGWSEGPPTTLRGSPFFVMELVQGAPITKYCDDHRLSPTERLRLFIPVCEAVQHAHQKGIIHRDLKPSNVLVAEYDGRPVTKIIDFGVAKAVGHKLTEQTLHTGMGAVIGTLEYMSPEQAAPGSEDIDTRSDIYSLGVLLYELLTGTTPLNKKRFQQAVMFEMLRVLREEDPPKPSTRLSSTDELPSIAAKRSSEPKQLTSLMRGELDWIVMRSLDKDRNRRYATANGLARDIERYLHDEPVEAGPPSTAYRFRKFLRRNRGPVFAATFLFIALVGGIVGTSIGLVRAEQGEKAARDERQVAQRQRDRAERHYQRALSAVDRLLTRVGTTELTTVPHMDQTRRRLLEDALEFYRGFLTDESDDPAVRREIGRAYGRIGVIQEELGWLDKSEEALNRAIEIHRLLVAENADVEEHRIDLLACQTHLAMVWHQSGRSSEGERLIRDILGREKFVTPKSRDHCVSLHYRLGMICHQTRRSNEAESAFKASLDLIDGLIRDDPDRDELVIRSTVLNMLGMLCHESRRWDEAERYYVAARDHLDQKLKTGIAHPDHLLRLCGVHTNLGLVYTAQDRRPQAQESHRKAVEVGSRLVADHPDLPDNKRFLANSHNNLALFYSRGGDARRAAEENEKSLKMFEELMQRYPRRLEFTVSFAGACGNQAKYLIEQQQWAESLPWNSKAINVLTALLGAEPRDTSARQSLFNSLLGRAGAYRTLNRKVEAAEDYRRVIEISEGERHANYVNFRPRALAYVGEYARATTEVEAIVAKGNPTGSNFKEFANVYSTCVSAARRDGTLNEADRESLGERYAARAVALVAKAGEKGHFPRAEQVAALRTDEKLQSIHDRADFKRLLADLETAARKPEKNE